MTNSLKEIIKKLVIPRHPEIVGYDVTMHDFFGTTRYDVEIIIGLCFFDIKINKIRSDIEFLFNMWNLNIDLEVFPLKIKMKK